MNAADHEISLHNRILALESDRKLACDAWVVSNDRAAALEVERDALRAEVRRRVSMDEYAWAIDKRDKARAERDKARAERDKAHAILTAALPHLERFPCVPWDGDVLARVRAWLGVSDG